MPLYALDDLDDALAVTRDFLTPVDRTAWLKLAVVAFFIGGPGANFNSFQYGGGPSGGGGPPPGLEGSLGPRVLAMIAAIVAAVLVIALAFALVGSVMEFVFVESLRHREVAVRRYWSRRWRQGLRLFGFRVVIGLVILAAMAVVALPVVLALAGIAPLGGGVPWLLLVVLLPLFLALALVVGVVNGFTTVFVVPVMIGEDAGVLAAWRRLWASIKGAWSQYLAYAVAGAILSVVGGVVVGLVTLVAAVLLLVPFGVLFAVGFGVFTVAEPVGIGILVVVGIGYGLSVLAAVALAQVPVQVFLRYYALLVLGDVAPSLDLIPDQRAGVHARD